MLRLLHVQPVLTIQLLKYYLEYIRVPGESSTTVVKLLFSVCCIWLLCQSATACHPVRLSSG